MTHAPSTVAALAVATLLSACASTSAPPPAAPDRAEVATTPAPAHARLYADCFGQAIANHSYRRAGGGGDELLLFTCTGGVAGAMYEALGPWSARIGSEWKAEGRVWRSTARVERNLFGVDYCSAADGGGDVRCVITFNAGDFLDQ
jgi:hypothetical protein